MPVLFRIAIIDIGSWSRILADYSSDSLLVLDLVSLEEVVCLGLGWGIGIRVVQKVLDSKQNLLDRDGGFPGFFLVQDRQANGSGRVDVGVEQGRHEFTCRYGQFQSFPSSKCKVDRCGTYTSGASLDTLVRREKMLASRRFGSRNRWKRRTNRQETPW